MSKWKASGSVSMSCEAMVALSHEARGVGRAGVGSVSLHRPSARCGQAGVMSSMPTSSGGPWVRVGDRKVSTRASDFQAGGCFLGSRPLPWEAQRSSWNLHTPGPSELCPADFEGFCSIGSASLGTSPLVTLGGSPAYKQGLKAFSGTWLSAEPHRLLLVNLERGSCTQCLTRGD